VSGGAEPKRTVAAPRSVSVATLGALAELGRVVQAGVVILVVTLVYLGTDSPLFRGQPRSQRNLMPFQAFVTDRPARDQLMFRELREGLFEAEAMRTEAGTWPSAAALADDGIPPFAPDPTRQTGPYEWRMLHDGLFTNYVGLPQRAGDPAWLLVVQEPIPNTPLEIARDDEDHAILPGPWILHVSVWVRDQAPAQFDRVAQVPSLDGWTQLYVVGPTISGGVSFDSTGAPIASPLGG
jgi:hypothetical protein